jgi:hypothetical protein
MNISIKASSGARWMLALLACLALGACKEQREPVKPTTGTGAAYLAG